ncbi:phage tail sheath family protein [Roseivirga pacifica]|nr:phage tail sheath C-terminal domain-containing protein [Roseivirga pacifica]
MAQMKTPGVYIVEKDAFGNGVVEVATAVPAFIGYTQRADNGGKSLRNKPMRITSMGEFMQFFGGAPIAEYTIAEAADEASSDITVKDKGYTVANPGQKYNLFNSMRLFYANGGGPCYIVSVGNYSDEISNERLKDNGIPPLLKEEEPTMVVVPEAIHLKDEDCIALQQAVLMHCQKMMSRIGILDIYDGYKQRNHPDGDVIDNFRNALGVNALNYAASYYPWVHTTIVGDTELGLQNIATDSLETLKGLLMEELGVAEAAEEGESPKITELRDLLAHIPNIREDAYSGPAVGELNKTLIVISPAFNNLLMHIKESLNLLPPSAAMAGIYTLVDNNRGVWKAPANVSLNAVTKPAVNISHDEQEDLNVTLHGKSINAIRPFIGEGVLVWGARTLDGNSKDWRYINVRRTMIMLEQSIKAATKAYVFEPNDSGTWTTIKSMIDSFLYNQWKKGALVGSVPEDAYSVSVGLGSTMTADDILEGILRVTILVAISRPAEFIEITFQQQMQKS